MYAVIKTGGKQYRVKPGDLLVVEKLAGEPGAKVAFDQVLMVGEGEKVSVGAPIVAGAKVDATLIETRKGEKTKIFKKIRRQGYRRTRGHRQTESVLRVTAVAGGGKTETWDGAVNLTPLAELTPPDVEVETVVEPRGAGKSPRARARVVESAEPTAPAAEAPVEAAPAKPSKASKKAAAPKKAPAGKGPSMRDVAKSGAPKLTKNTVRTPAVRKTSPRGKG